MSREMEKYRPAPPPTPFDSESNFIAPPPPSNPVSGWWTKKKLESVENYLGQVNRIEDLEYQRMTRAANKMTDQMLFGARLTEQVEIIRHASEMREIEKAKAKETLEQERMKTNKMYISTKLDQLDLDRRLKEFADERAGED